MVEHTDYLDEDADLRGQKYVCISFVSPEDVIKNKEAFMFSKYLTKFSADMNDLLGNIESRFSDQQDIRDMVTLIKQRYDCVFSGEGLEDDYNFFKSTETDVLENDYLKLNNFQTSVRGIKVRGSYETEAEARARAEAITKFDPNFNVYVAQVGRWCPWSPNPSDIADCEYAEEQLNTLMKNYKNSQEARNNVYDARTRELVEKAQKANTNVRVIEDDEEPSPQRIVPSEPVIPSEPFVPSEPQ